MGVLEQIEDLERRLESGETAWMEAEARRDHLDTHAIVTGAAGFLGSHLVDRLLREGWSVTGIDSMITGELSNLSDVIPSTKFRFIREDVSGPLGVYDFGSVQWILHLASPASPIDYLAHPIETLQAGSVGTLRLLDLAVHKKAKFLLASTSEVYGDPAVHPQPETYWGNVNPIGPRSVYDEAKRFAEAATMAYHREHGLDVRIARIFNTYGPGMRPSDGRAVPNFIDQALWGQPLTVHGDGTQTRSLCYVDDLIEGLWRLMRTPFIIGPVNLGNPEEVSMLELATLINRLTGNESSIKFEPRPTDDPEHRRPDITLAQRHLQWQPTTPLIEGLRRTIVAQMQRHRIWS